MNKKPVKKPKLDLSLGAAFGGRQEGSGRKKFEPTDKEALLVRRLSGYGLTQEQIASLIREGISVDTLVKYFRTPLDRGKSAACRMIAKRAFDKAMEGDTTMLIWWTKTQMGWRENKDQADGKDQDVNIKVTRVSSKK